MRALALTALFGISCLASSAQQRYLKAGGGYSFPVPSVQLGQNVLNEDKLVTDPETGYYVPGTILSTTEQVRGSYNSGVLPAFALGYIFPSNIGVELSMGYVFGKEYTFSDKYSEHLDGELQRQRLVSSVWQGKNPYVAPALVITTDERPLRPFVSAGVVFAFPTITESYESSSDFNPVETTFKEDKYSRGLGIGMRGAAGLDVKLSGKLYLFVEVAFTSLTYHPKQRETLEYEVNGEDAMSTLSTPVVKLTKETTAGYPATGGKGEEIGRSFVFSGLATLTGLKFHL